MHPYSNDTLILIDIQAENRAEILQCVQESFGYMPGWMFVHAASLVMSNGPEERFFCFNLTQKLFDWWRANNTFSDTMDEGQIHTTLKGRCLPLTDRDDW